jgi:DNA-directed RNA polymerase subunit RPC12/RpoP
MDIVTKCGKCTAEFDVDDLRYDEEQGRFGCPKCGAIEFQLLVKEDEILK